MAVIFMLVAFPVRAVALFDAGLSRVPAVVRGLHGGREGQHGG
jgi:hypothetical protein